MSDEQAAALVKLAVAKGLLPPPEEPAPEDGTGLVVGRGLPMVQLPGPARLGSAFAAELGRHCARDGFMFRQKDRVLAPNFVERELEEVTPHAFQTLVEDRVICFTEVWSRESVRTVSQTMGVEVARTTLRAPAFRDCLPQVDRVNRVRLPVMRAPTKEDPRGTIELLPEGYDAPSRTFTFSAPGVTYDETVTVDAAVNELITLLSEFPFSDWPAKDAPGPATSRSLAVVVAGMLTMFGVGILPERSGRPCFVYSSNSPRTGKTLLAKLAVGPVTGSCATTSLPAKEEELRKQLDTEVQAKSPFLLVDNLRGLIASPAIEALITTSEWTGRVLGSKEKFVLPQTMTLFLTGNQATLNEDMMGRVMFIELFLESADPQARRVSREIEDWWIIAPENRSRILSALWAIMRDWDAAGRPENPARLAGFDAWVRRIAGMVLHAGLGDCMAPAKMEQGGNTEMIDMRALVWSLASDVDPAAGRGVAVLERPATEATEFEFAEIVDCAVDGGLFDWILVDGKELNPKEKSTFGKLLKKYSGRVFNYEAGKQVRFGHRGKHRGRRYQLARV